MRKQWLIKIGSGALALSLTAAGGGLAGGASFATLKGTVKLQGSIPKPSHMEMSADPKCAQIHPASALAEDIVANSSGGLQNAVVYISDGLGDRKFEPPQEPAVLEQNGCQYKPHVVALQANQELKVVNADPTTHNIHPTPNNNREFNQIQPPGVPLSTKFAREEIAIPVKCNIHPWMKSYIAVFRHPYFAVTAKDGSFEIGNLAPGTYTITAWHEKLGTATQKITVGESETKTMEFVFKGLSGS